MKKLIFVVALLVMVSSICSAQKVVTISSYFLTSGKHYLASTGDSVANLSIAYTGQSPYIATGAQPDSIRVFRYATTDTLLADIVFKAKGGGGNFTYTFVDSMKAGAWKGSGISPSAWYGCDVMGISILQRATGASVVATNNKAWVRLDRYFTIPPK